jgi:hypothetical protein
MCTLSGFRIVRALILSAILTVFKHSRPPGAFWLLASLSSWLQRRCGEHSSPHAPLPPGHPAGDTENSDESLREEGFNYQCYM